MSRKLKRGRSGAIYVAPKYHKLILDMEIVLKGIPLDRPKIKRATTGIDLSEIGGKDYPDIAEKVTYWRELNGKPDPVTVGQVSRAMTLLRGINSERDKDRRYGFFISRGRKGVNAIGDTRYVIKEYDEVFKKDDTRLRIISTGDLQSNQIALELSYFEYELCKDMVESADDPMLRARWKIKMGQHLEAIGKMELALFSTYA